MENLCIADIVKFNKDNAKALGQFMSERIDLPDGRPGKILSQFLAEERAEGRYPILGEGTSYCPIKEEAIIVAPQKWGVTTPEELIGASVGFRVIGTIPIIKDHQPTMEILVIRLTEPDGTEPSGFVYAGWTSVSETDIYLGRDTWVNYPVASLTQTGR